MALTTLQFKSRKERDAHYHKLQVLGHKLMTRGTTQQGGHMLWELYYEPRTLPLVQSGPLSDVTGRASEAVAELETLPANDGATNERELMAALPLTREVSDGPIEGESGVEGSASSNAERASVTDAPASGTVVGSTTTLQQP